MRDSQILVQSLVDGDSARVDRFRRLRRKAVLFSVVVEAMVLAALLLAPLASPESLTRRHQWTPIPPFGRASHVSVRPVPPHGDYGPRRPFPIISPYQHPMIHGPIPRPDDSPGENSDPNPGVGPGEGQPGDRDGVLFGNNSPISSRPPEPPKPAEHVVTRVTRSEGVQLALLINRVVPAYPPLPRQARIEGEVKLHAIIGTDGTIRSLEVESGHPLLVQAALDAVRQWRYRPALLSGRPVEVETFITVIFHLQQ